MNSELRGRANQSELEGMPHYSPCVKYKELFPKLVTYQDSHYGIGLTAITPFR